MRDDAGATARPWRVANSKGVAAVKGEHCAVYINVRTVETDECVRRWQSDARLIVAAVNNVEALAEALRRFAIVGGVALDEGRAYTMSASDISAARAALAAWESGK